jgi:hypothetical protein
MKIFVVGALLLRTLNAQAPLIVPGPDAPAESDLLATDVPTRTADVVLDSTASDEAFGGDATAGPGFSFPTVTPAAEEPESASIVIPVFSRESTDSVIPEDDAAAAADDETTSTDEDLVYPDLTTGEASEATASAPEYTDLPSDPDCPSSCYEGSSRLRRRQGVPSSNGGFAALQWPGDTMRYAAQDDECADDIPDWLSEFAGKKRAACQQVCPEKCYASDPNSALDEGYGDESTTEEGYGDDSTTEEGYGHESTTEEGYDDESTTEEGYGDDSTTEEGYDDESTTEEGYGDDSTTEEGYGHDSTTEEGYSDESTTEEGYSDESTTEEGYGDDSTTEEGYGHDSTTEEGYGDDSTTDEGYGDESTTITGGYGGGMTPTSTQTTFVTSTKTAVPYTPGGSSSEPGYTGSTIAGICPQQCNPFDPAQNKCDITTSCTTTGNNKYYCACRAGFSLSKWNAKDFTKQFKFAAQPYVYVAPGEVCDKVCSDQTCSEIIARPSCQ